MKKQYVMYGMLIIALSGVYSVGQEFVISTKNKRKYVSEQQCLELAGDIVVVGTEATGMLADLSKAVFLIIKSCLEKVNKYVDGEKSSLDKVTRTDLYEKYAQIKQELDRCNDEMDSIRQRLVSLYAEAQKIQFE